MNTYSSRSLKSKEGLNQFVLRRVKIEINTSLSFFRNEVKGPVRKMIPVLLPRKKITPVLKFI